MYKELNLNMPTISFDSSLVQLIVQLEVLRSKSVSLEMNPELFTQIKSIFHMIESLQSARIEGNRTTISDYVTSKFDNSVEKDNTKEIGNIESAIHYINTCYNEENFKISSHFLCELHSIITNDLKTEGSKEKGKYRSCGVKINKSKHTPPDAIFVNEYMERLIEWINTEDKLQMQLLKIAIAHHAFTWIHPFDNGNGRMSRLLTYSMLMQYKFNMAYLLNSTAVFCIDRNKYFEMLQKADNGTNEERLEWCEYVLEGINNEMSKLSNLMNKEFFVDKIAMPAINKAFELHFINQEHKTILELALRKDDGLIKSKDIQEVVPHKTKRQVTTLISKMLEMGLLCKPEPSGRLYMVNLFSKDLARGIVESLYREKLIIIEE